MRLSRYLLVLGKEAHKIRSPLNHTKANSFLDGRRQYNLLSQLNKTLGI